MKSIFKKLIVFSLAAITCFGAVGCDKGDDKTSTNGGNVNVDSYVESNVLDPNHSTIVKDTDNYLYLNGKSDYVIVVPALQKDNTYIAEAVRELNYFLSLAAGTTLPVTVDTGLTFDEESKYISLGNTTLLSQIDYKIDKMSSKDGYEIINKGKSVFIIGGGESGVMFGAYKFLYHEIGFEAFAQSEIKYNVSKNVKLYDYDVREVPDIDVRHVFSGDYARNGGLEFSHRMGVNGYDDYILYIDGDANHTSLALAPPEIYAADHPEWYEVNKTQLCYTRDVEGLSKVVVDKIKQEMLANTSAKIVSITHEDGGAWCSCKQCSDAKSKYGANSAGMLNFISVCAREINRWLSAPTGDSNGSYTDDFEQVYGYQGPIDREVYVMMFAYVFTAAAPSYVDFEIEDNVAIQWAPISANFNYSMNHDANKSFKATIETWTKYVKNVMYWSYSIQEVNSYIPINPLNAIQESYQYMKSIGTSYIFQESNAVYKMVDWDALKSYVYAKLMWNVNANVPALIDNFTKNYYGPAADAVKSIFEDEQDYQVYLADILNRTGYGGMETQGDPSFWPQAVLFKYTEMLDDAQKELDQLFDTDPLRAQTIANRIKIEQLPFRYLMLKNYKNFYSESEYAKQKEQLIADVNALGALEGPYDSAQKRMDSFLEAL